MPPTTIHSLPPEVIQEIIKEAIRSTRITCSSNLPSVLGVCSQWRTLALSLPEPDRDCWAVWTIDMTIRYPSNHPEPKLITDRLRKWADFAGQHSVDLAIWDKRWDSLEHSVTIGSSSLANSTLDFLSGPEGFPNLRSYWEFGRHSLIRPLFYILFRRQSFQNLTHLRIERRSNPPLLSDILLSELTVLSCPVSWLHVLQCPRLETLLFANRPITSPGHRGRPFYYLPSFQILDRFPKLKSLILDVLQVGENDGFGNVAPTDSILQSIRNLAIGWVSDYDRQPLMLEKIVPRLTSVTSLTLRDFDYIGWTKRRFDAASITELSILEHHLPSHMDPHSLYCEDWGEGLFSSLQGLRTLQIGQDPSRWGDPLGHFSWPLFLDRSEVHWSKMGLAMLMLVLGSKRPYHNTPKNEPPFYYHCPKLQHIRLNGIPLDEPILSRLLACLEGRQSLWSLSTECIVSTAECSWERGFFPNVTKSPFKDFERIIIGRDGDPHVNDDHVGEQVIIEHEDRSESGEENKGQTAPRSPRFNRIELEGGER